MTRPSVWVDDDTIAQTRFVDSAKPSKAPKRSISDGLVDKSAKAPKSRLSPMKIHKSSPAGIALHNGSALTECSDDTRVNEGAKAPKSCLCP